MAVEYIATNTSKRLGADLRQAVHALKEVRSDFRELKAVMETMIDYDPELPADSPVKFATLETEFGLPTGRGETVYNLVAGSLVSLEASDVNNVIIRLG